MKIEIKLVTCPCCHGRKRILVYERDDDVVGDACFRLVGEDQCCHCQGKGKVHAEVEEIA